MTLQTWITRLLLAITLLSLAACNPTPTPGAGQTPSPTQTGTSAPTPAQTLAGTQWTLSSFGTPGAQTAALGGTPVTLTFGPDAHISGSGGCNSYGGGYQIADGKISFTKVVSTMMACMDGNVMAQERQYFDALNSSGAYEISGDALVIHTSDEKNTLTFQRGLAATPTPAVETATSMPPTPEASATPAAVDTPTPTSGAPTATPSAGQADYLDDRSTATGLVQSYFNAINRHEYLRAYSYWRDPAGSQGSFDQFQNGYAKTTLVNVNLGQIGGDAGAGQMYYSVPALLQAYTSDGKTQNYAACYILHLSQPGIQAEPPFNGLAIERGRATPLDCSNCSADAIANACSGPDFPSGQPITPTPVTNTRDITQNNYLDDRSDPVLVLSSLFNAINRHEYARAYSYWDTQNNPGSVPPFADFQKGYADTASVEMTAGKPVTDVGAGQYNYSVPVVLTSHQTGGVVQVYSGCYLLHLSSPSAQATPPFRAIMIRSGKLKVAPTGADPAKLLQQGCAP